MSEERLGQLFAILTACCWVTSANFFELAGRRIGSLVVNLLRLSLAVVLLAILCVAVRGSAWPGELPGRVLMWVTVSGFLGFFLCDMCLFRAFVLAGARRSMLMLALAPCFAAVLDVIARQPPTLQMVVGMIVTLSGVAWVIVGRQATEESPHTRRDIRTGVLLGLAAALFQALGAKSAQIGLPADLSADDALLVTMVRCAAGAVAFAMLLAMTGRSRSVAAGVRDRVAVAQLTIGCVFGPVIGVALFLASLSRVQPSVTQTILATMPVLMLPVSHFIRGEKLAWQAVAGTFVAVAGVIVLCWR